MVTIFPWEYIILFCFKQLLLNFTLILAQRANFGVRLLSNVVGGLITSSNNPLDFHNKL